jgi:hypothetical protein
MISFSEMVTVDTVIDLLISYRVMVTDAVSVDTNAVIFGVVYCATVFILSRVIGLITLDP